MSKLQPFICFLRGINVSGQKLIKMSDLKETLQKELPFTQVTTYIQSGNLWFLSAEMNEQKLENWISSCIQKHFGFEVPVLVRTPTYFEQILNNNPFLIKYPEQTDRCYYVFLSDEPRDENKFKLNPEDYLPEEFAFGNKVVYFFSPGGLGKARLSNNYFETKLKVTATTRNKNTVEKMLSI